VGDVEGWYVGEMRELGLKVAPPPFSSHVPCAPRIATAGSSSLCNGCNLYPPVMPESTCMFRQAS
jgi:hypothetical protein